MGETIPPGRTSIPEPFRSGMTDPPNIRVGLTAKPENVALIREVLAGVADVVDLGDALEDVKAAVSEAANNVVMHAYGGEDGPMVVEVSLRPGLLEVVVADDGAGVGLHALDDASPGRGIGLVVIEALTASWDLRARAGGGVEVAMRFPMRLAAPPRVEHAQPPDALWGESELSLSIAPASLSAALLNRFLTSAAARAGFSIDRVSDVQLVADALVSQLATSLLRDRLTVGIDVERGRLRLRVGPLREGGATRIIDGASVAVLGPIIERLVDGSSSDRDGTEEILTLEMADRRRDGPVAAGAG